MGMKNKIRSKVLKFTQNKWLKPFIDLKAELASWAGKKFQENMNKNLSGTFVEDVRKVKRLVTAKTAKEVIKVQSKITYGNYKQFETEDGENLLTIYSLNKRGMTFSEPIHIGFQSLN